MIVIWWECGPHTDYQILQETFMKSNISGSWEVFSSPPPPPNVSGVFHDDSGVEITGLSEYFQKTTAPLFQASG